MAEAVDLLQEVLELIFSYLCIASLLSDIFSDSSWKCVIKKSKFCRRSRMTVDRNYYNVLKLLILKTVFTNVVEGSSEPKRLEVAGGGSELLDLSSLDPDLPPD